MVRDRTNSVSTVVSVVPSLNNPGAESVQLGRFNQQKTVRGLFSKRPAPVFPSKNVSASRGIFPSLQRYFSWSFETNRHVLIARVCLDGSYQDVEFVVAHRHELSSVPLKDELFSGLSQKQVLILEVLKLCLQEPAIYLPIYQEIFSDPNLKSDIDAVFPHLEIVPEKFRGLPLAYFTPEVVEAIATKKLPAIDVRLTLGSYKDALPIWPIVCWLTDLEPYEKEDHLFGVNKKGEISPAQWFLIKGLEAGRLKEMLERLPALRQIINLPFSESLFIPKRWEGLSPLIISLLRMELATTGALLQAGARLDGSRAFLRIANDGKSIIFHILHHHPSLLEQLIPALGDNRTLRFGDHFGLTGGQVLLLEMLMKVREEEKLEPLKNLINSKDFKETCGYLLTEMVPEHPRTPPEWIGLTFGQIIHLQLEVPKELRVIYEKEAVSTAPLFIFNADETALFNGVTEFKGKAVLLLALQNNHLSLISKVINRLTLDHLGQSTGANQTLLALAMHRGFGQIYCKKMTGPSPLLKVPFPESDLIPKEMWGLTPLTVSYLSKDKQLFDQLWAKGARPDATMRIPAGTYKGGTDGHVFLMEAVEREDEDLLNKVVTDPSTDRKLLGIPFPDVEEEVPWEWRRGLTFLTILATRLSLFPNKRNLEKIFNTCREYKKVFFETENVIKYGPYKGFTDGQLLVRNVIRSCKEEALKCVLKRFEFEPSLSSEWLRESFPSMTEVQPALDWSNLSPWSVVFLKKDKARTALLQNYIVFDLNSSSASERFLALLGDRYKGFTAGEACLLFSIMNDEGKDFSRLLSGSTFKASRTTWNKLSSKIISNGFYNRKSFAQIFVLACLDTRNIDLLCRLIKMGGPYASPDLFLEEASSEETRFVWPTHFVALKGLEFASLCQIIEALYSAKAQLSFTEGENDLSRDQFLILRNVLYGTPQTCEDLIGKVDPASFSTPLSYSTFIPEECRGLSPATVLYLRKNKTGAQNDKQIFQVLDNAGLVVTDASLTYRNESITFITGSYKGWTEVQILLNRALEVNDQALLNKIIRRTYLPLEHKEHLSFKDLFVGKGGLNFGEPCSEEHFELLQLILRNGDVLKTVQERPNLLSWVSKPFPNHGVIPSKFRGLTPLTYLYIHAKSSQAQELWNAGARPSDERTIIGGDCRGGTDAQALLAHFLEANVSPECIVDPSFKAAVKSTFPSVEGTSFWDHRGGLSPLTVALTRDRPAWVAQFLAENTFYLNGEKTISFGPNKGLTDGHVYFNYLISKGDVSLLGKSLELLIKDPTQFRATLSHPFKRDLTLFSIIYLDHPNLLAPFIKTKALAIPLTPTGKEEVKAVLRKAFHEKNVHVVMLVVQYLKEIPLETRSDFLSKIFTQKSADYHPKKTLEELLWDHSVKSKAYSFFFPLIELGGLFVDKGLYSSLGLKLDVASKGLIVAQDLSLLEKQGVLSRPQLLEFVVCLLENGVQLDEDPTLVEKLLTLGFSVGDDALLARLVALMKSEDLEKKLQYQDYLALAAASSGKLKTFVALLQKGVSLHFDRAPHSRSMNGMTTSGLTVGQCIVLLLVRQNNFNELACALDQIEGTEHQLNRSSKNFLKLIIEEAVKAQAGATLSYLIEREPGFREMDLYSDPIRTSLFGRGQLPLVLLLPGPRLQVVSSFLKEGVEATELLPGLEPLVPEGMEVLQWLLMGSIIENDLAFLEEIIDKAPRSIPFLAHIFPNEKITPRPLQGKTALSVAYERDNKRMVAALLTRTLGVCSANVIEKGPYAGLNDAQLHLLQLVISKEIDVNAIRRHISLNKDKLFLNAEIVTGNYIGKTFEDVLIIVGMSADSYQYQELMIGDPSLLTESGYKKWLSLGSKNTDVILNLLERDPKIQPDWFYPPGEDQPFSGELALLVRFISLNDLEKVLKLRPNLQRHLFTPFPIHDKVDIRRQGLTPLDLLAKFGLGQWVFNYLTSHADEIDCDAETGKNLIQRLGGFDHKEKDLFRMISNPKLTLAENLRAFNALPSLDGFTPDFDELKNHPVPPAIKQVEGIDLDELLTIYDAVFLLSPVNRKLVATLIENIRGRRYIGITAVPSNAEQRDLFYCDIDAWLTHIIVELKKRSEQKIVVRNAMNEIVLAAAACGVGWHERIQELFYELTSPDRMTFEGEIWHQSETLRSLQGQDLATSTQKQRGHRDAMQPHYHRSLLKGIGERMQLRGHHEAKHYDDNYDPKLDPQSMEERFVRDYCTGRILILWLGEVLKDDTELHNKYRAFWEMKLRPQLEPAWRQEILKTQEPDLFEKIETLVAVAEKGESECLTKDELLELDFLMDDTGSRIEYTYENVEAGLLQIKREHLDSYVSEVNGHIAQAEESKAAAIQKFKQKFQNLRWKFSVNQSDKETLKAILDEFQNLLLPVIEVPEIPENLTKSLLPAFVEKMEDASSHDGLSRARFGYDFKVQCDELKKLSGAKLTEDEIRRLNNASKSILPNLFPLEVKSNRLPIRRDQIRQKVDAAFAKTITSSYIWKNIYSLERGIDWSKFIDALVIMKAIKPKPS